jgi:hypothetical protein
MCCVVVLFVPGALCGLLVNRARRSNTSPASHAQARLKKVQTQNQTKAERKFEDLKFYLCKKICQNGCQ